MSSADPKAPTGFLRRLIRVTLGVWRQMNAQNLGLIAAGIAFYGLLSIFPAITAAVALAGLFIDDRTLLTTSDFLATLLPDQARDIILGQLAAVVRANTDSLSLAALLALMLALYSGSRAVDNFVSGLNIVNGLDETRGFVHRKALTMGLTLAMILGLLMSISVVAAIPGAAALVGVDGAILNAMLTLRWPLLLIISAIGIAVLYRFAPDRRGARWRWLTPGAGLACFLWVACSYGFSQYVQSFGSYNETFGALGGVIILLTWMWLSSFIILIGALVDVEIEASRPGDVAKRIE